jgi:acetoin utilization protein AcuB
MNTKELEAFAKKAAKGIKTTQDLNNFSRMLKKITVEAALNAEMDEHLGYEKHAKSVVKNSRNGMMSKRIKTEDGVIPDRDLLKFISPFIGIVQETVHDKFTLSKKVHQIMTRKPITLKPSANMYQAIRLFNQHNISCIPIVNERDESFGIVSWRYIVNVIEDNYIKKLTKAK